MQSRDEGRHFLRACQIARGQLLSQSDSATGQVGGVLPVAEADFVRDKMTTDFLRQEDGLRTMRARLAALEQWARKQPPFVEQRFVPFTAATIYAPVLYIPQVIGVRLATTFTQKVYTIFYAARILNAITAVTLISFALYLARGHEFLLMLPAALPMSLYQIASVSSDGGVIALSVLFVALCLRFEHKDGRGLRFWLVFSSWLLTLGKPVYLPAALLGLTSCNRLGWKRAAAFCLQVTAIDLFSYLTWSYTVRSFFAKPLPDAVGRDPFTQIHTLISHPGLATSAFAATLTHQGWHIWFDVIGFFGWGALALPTWFYVTASGLALAIFGCTIVNVKMFDPTRFMLGLVTAVIISIAVFVAAYVLWTPPESIEVVGVQGRYFIPALVVFLFAVPSLHFFSKYSRACLCTLSIGFFFLSAWWTTRTVDAYYFPQHTLLGQNVHKLFGAGPAGSCPASEDVILQDRFALLEGGQSTARASAFRVVLTNETGVVIGESDPRLIGNDPREWRAHVWMPDKPGRVDSWLIQGGLACPFAHVEVKPSAIPET